MLADEQLGSNGAAHPASASLFASASSPASTAQPLSSNARVLTLDEAILELGTGRFQIWLLFAVGCFFLSSALQFALVSFLGFAVQCEEPSWNVQSGSIALFSMLIFFGMLVGTMLWGLMGDRHGRKPTMVAVAGTSLVLSVLRGLSTSFTRLMILQFILGITLSGFGVAFTFFVEFFPSAERARWSLLLTVFWTLGVVLATLVAWLSDAKRYGWKGQVYLSSISLVVNLAAMLSLPESPRFSLSTGKAEQAKRVLEQAARLNRVDKEAYALAPISGISVKSNGLGIMAALGPNYRKTSLLLYIIWFLCGFGYYGAMQMSTTIDVARAEMSAAGSGGESNASSCPDLAVQQLFSTQEYVDSLIGSLAELPGILLAGMLVDRVGRRFAQTFALVGFATAMLGICVLPGSRASDQILLFVARALSNTSYSVTWIYTPEVFPTAMRTTAFALSECFSHIGAMVTPFVAQTMLVNGLLVGAAGIYAAAALVGACASNSLTVETAGREFIEEESNGRRVGRRPSFGLTGPAGPALPRRAAAVVAEDEITNI